MSLPDSSSPVDGASAFSRFKDRLRVVYFRTRDLLAWHDPRKKLQSFLYGWQIRRDSARRRREPRLTVAVDGSAFWEPLTGVGWYLYRLLEALAHRDDVRLRIYGPYLVEGHGYPPPVVPPPQGPALEWVVYRPPHRIAGPPQAWVHRILLHRANRIADDGNQVLFAPNYLLPEHFERDREGSSQKDPRHRTPRVTMVHDLGSMKVPWTLQETTLETLQANLERTFRDSHRILTPSEAVRGEILEATALATERVVAVHHGPGQTSLETPGDFPPDTPARFAMHVGTIEPRKNLGVILEAWRQLQGRPSEESPGADQQTLQLVLCGRLGWNSEELSEEIAAAEAAGWLRHFGYVANDELAALYRRAELVVFPTLYEGFGLPALEAQEAGAPLLASDLPVLREVAGAGALYLPPDDPAAWAEAVETLTASPERRRELADAGRENARGFRWQRTAEETLEVFRQAANLRPSTDG